MTYGLQLLLFSSSWLDNFCWQRSVKEHFGTLVRAAFGAEPGQISMLFLLLVAATSGGFRKLFFSPKLNIVGGTGNVVNR